MEEDYFEENYNNNFSNVLNIINNNFKFSYSNRYDYIRYYTLRKLDFIFYENNNNNKINIIGINGLKYIVKVVDEINVKYNEKFSEILQLPTIFYERFEPEFYLEIYLLFQIIYYYKENYNRNNIVSIINFGNVIFLEFGYLIIPIEDWMQYAVNYVNNVNNNLNDQLRLKFLYRDFISIIIENQQDSTFQYTNLGNYIEQQVDSRYEISIQTMNHDVYFVINNYKNILENYYK